jgi:hypothetical protein
MRSASRPAPPFSPLRSQLQSHGSIKSDTSEPQLNRDSTTKGLFNYLPIYILFSSRSLSLIISIDRSHLPNVRSAAEKPSFEAQAVRRSHEETDNIIR